MGLLYQEVTYSISQGGNYRDLKEDALLVDGHLDITLQYLKPVTSLEDSPFIRLALGKKIHPWASNVAKSEPRIFSKPNYSKDIYNIIISRSWAHIDEQKDCMSKIIKGFFNVTLIQKPKNLSISKETENSLPLLKIRLHKYLSRSLNDVIRHKTLLAVDFVYLLATFIPISI